MRERAGTTASQPGNIDGGDMQGATLMSRQSTKYIQFLTQRIYVLYEHLRYLPLGNADV